MIYYYTGLRSFRILNEVISHRENTSANITDFKVEDIEARLAGKY